MPGQKPLPQIPQPNLQPAGPLPPPGFVPPPPPGFGAGPLPPPVGQKPLPPIQAPPAPPKPGQNRNPGHGQPVPPPAPPQPPQNNLDTDTKPRPKRKGFFRGAAEELLKTVGFSLNFFSNKKILAAGVLFAAIAPALFPFAPLAASAFAIAAAGALVLSAVSALINKLMDRVLGSSNVDRAHNAERENKLTGPEETLAKNVQKLHELFSGRIYGWDTWATKHSRGSLGISDTSAKFIRADAKKNGIEFDDIYRDLKNLTPKRCEAVLKAAGFEGFAQCRALHDVLTRKATTLSDKEQAVVEAVKPLVAAIRGQFPGFDPAHKSARDNGYRLNAGHYKQLLNDLRPGKPNTFAPDKVQAIQKALDALKHQPESLERALSAAGLRNAICQAQIRWLVKDLKRLHEQKDARDHDHAKQIKRTVHGRDLSFRTR